MIKQLVGTILLGMMVVLDGAAAAQEIEGWVTDHYLATYLGPPPEPNTGSAHLPAFVRATVDENHIAVIGWDIYTPERSDGLLSMLLSTTWESSMEPWPENDEWFVSSQQMPMSDGSSWHLWYQRTGASSFRLGAPPFIDPEKVPHYIVTDPHQRQWLFMQPFLVIPEPSSLVLAGIGVLGLTLRPRKNRFCGRRDSPGVGHALR